MTKRHIRYFTCMELVPEYELSEAEAMARGSYNAAYFAGDDPLHVEHRTRESIDSVVYFRDPWPPSAPAERGLFAEHRR